jgi:hypothetical protein
MTYETLTVLETFRVLGFFFTICGFFILLLSLWTKDLIIRGMGIGVAYAGGLCFLFLWLANGTP